LEIHKRTIVNKIEYGDSSRTANGEGKFKFKTKEGAGVGGIIMEVQRCFCLDVQRFERHSTKVSLTPN